MPKSDFMEKVKWERSEQVVKRGYDAAHDAGMEYAHGELAEVACYLAFPGEYIDGDSDGDLPVETLLPASRQMNEHRYRDHDPLTRLVKAAALLWAEYDRLKVAGS
jgi:hypothetical protein